VDGPDGLRGISGRRWFRQSRSSDLQQATILTVCLALWTVCPLRRYFSVGGCGEQKKVCVRLWSGGVSLPEVSGPPTVAANGIPRRLESALPSNGTRSSERLSPFTEKFRFGPSDVRGELWKRLEERTQSGLRQRGMSRTKSVVQTGEWEAIGIVEMDNQQILDCCVAIGVLRAELGFWMSESGERRFVGGAFESVTDGA